MYHHLYVTLFYVITTPVEQSIIINIIEIMKDIYVINAFGGDAVGRLVRINKKEVKLVASKISLDGRDYAFVKNEKILKKYSKKEIVQTGNLYDYDSYLRTQKGSGNAVAVDKLLIFKSGRYEIEKIR